jgi:hypothetical protein
MRSKETLESNPVSLRSLTARLSKTTALKHRKTEKKMAPDSPMAFL